MNLESLMSNHVLLAVLATCFTWLMTALGSGLVFFFKEIKPKFLNMMLGFASGVMIAASFFSLLLPAIEASEGGNVPAWAVVALGFLLGAGFLWLFDHLVPHLHLGASETEGPKTSLKRSILLVLSITLHNIPEGLAVGVAFGSLGTTGSLLAAMAVALGIGIQNFPEGAAVSIPLRKEGLSRFKSFLYGQASGMVEPLSALAGAALVSVMKPILPYALAFAAGAMIYVVVEELIPEAQNGDHEATHLSTVGCILGFVVMMILDVALG